MRQMITSASRIRTVVVEPMAVGGSRMGTARNSTVPVTE
jgi:hypothetical protein